VRVRSDLSTWIARAPERRPTVPTVPSPSPSPSPIVHPYVHGDSTPFEPGFDFIASLRAAVACGVALMKAQHAIDCARARVSEAEEHLVLTRADLCGLADAVDEALASHVSRRTDVRSVALRVATMARGATTVQVRHLQSALDATVVRADAMIVEARKTAAAALGELLASHELPRQAVGFRVFAVGGRYAAESIVALPGGLRATFDASIPESHPLRAPCRVRDLREGVSVTLPQTVGWFSKRVESVPVPLGGLTVLGASVDGTRGALLLGKNERSGIAHSFDVDLGSAVPRVQWRDADDRSVFDLGAEDAALVTRLLRDIERRSRVVPLARTSMTEALLESRPVGEQDPGQVCARIVELVSPETREIARRSGAPGELVLRRNVDSGHRDEVFVTSAELLEMIDTLPPSLRGVFAPLGLGGTPRSRRAPPRSLSTYEELSASALMPVS
jgi:hypothetical protein